MFGRKLKVSLHTTKKILDFQTGAPRAKGSVSFLEVPCSGASTVNQLHAERITRARRRSTNDSKTPSVAQLLTQVFTDYALKLL